MVTQREDFSRIAVLPLRGQCRLNTVSIFKIIVKKATVVVARFGFFSGVELAVTLTLSTYNSVVKIHRVPSSGLAYGVPISQA